MTRQSENGMTGGCALPTLLDSPRFARVEGVGAGWWVHRLRITDLAELEDEVQDWLCESYRLMGMQERLE